MTDKNIDKAKGRVKEAAGALTGDRRLARTTAYPSASERLASLRWCDRASS